MWSVVFGKVFENGFLLESKLPSVNSTLLAG